MANIQTLLQRIMSAIYGEEVRGSIHDAIEAINDEVTEWTGLQDGTVTTAKLASNAVTTAKVADGAITRAKLNADVVDTTLSVSGAPADAKAVGDALSGAGSGIQAKVNSLYEEKTLSWCVSQPHTYGWEKGYYKGEVGETYSTSSSNNYLRYHFGIDLRGYSSLKDALYIAVTPPSDYAVQLIETTMANVIIAKFGEINTNTYPDLKGKQVIVPFNPEHKYIVNIGRFNDNDSPAYLTEEFINSISLTAYFKPNEEKTDELTAYFDKTSENLLPLPTNYRFHANDIYAEFSDGVVTLKGTATGQFVLKISNGIVYSTSIVEDWKSEVIDNMDVGKTYAFKSFTVSGAKPDRTGIRLYDSERILQLSDFGNQVTLTTVPAFWCIIIPSQTVCDWTFKPICIEGRANELFYAELSDWVKVPTGTDNYERTGDFEFFTVEVERPLPFNDEVQTTETQEVECVLRLPTTYTPTGEKTRLILACHGASGYIDASTNTWYNSSWKGFMNDLLSAGYAVFDANVLPSSTGTEQMGYALGSPLYVNVLKKAYDYIVSHYNVHEKIFAHGTSMGGVGATAFSHAYPQLVLAESSFAGRDFLRYLYALNEGTGDDPFAISYGYASLDDLTADKFSHADGLFPSLSLVKYVNGVAQLPPDRETAYQSWLDYFTQVADLGRNDDAGDWTGCRKVPYKAWNSWADNVGYTKMQTVLQKAYNKGNACPYYLVNYETGTHTEMSYGTINDMRDQLIAWYKRWE